MVLNTELKIDKAGANFLMFHSSWLQTHLLRFSLSW
jgi:hypothetical protein